MQVLNSLYSLERTMNVPEFSACIPTLFYPSPQKKNFLPLLLDNFFLLNAINFVERLVNTLLYFAWNFNKTISIWRKTWFKEEAKKRNYSKDIPVKNRVLKKWKGREQESRAVQGVT